MTDLFSAAEWGGEFFTADMPEVRFQGRVKYSPNDGIRFSYRLIDRSVVRACKVVNGILDNGLKCSLFANFNPENTGVTFQNGLVTFPGENRPMYLVVGDFIQEDEPINEVTFSLTNMQEFFFPSGHKSRVKYSPKPIFEVKTPYGQLIVEHHANFNFLWSDIESQIHVRNPDALKDLSAAFSEIRAKYPKELFLLKNDISYKLRIKFDSAVSLTSAYRRVLEISDLFALLTYNPVYAEEIKIHKNGHDEPPLKVSLFPSRYLDSRTIELSVRKHTHQLMPISSSTVSLDALIKNWLSESYERS